VIVMIFFVVCDVPCNLVAEARWMPDKRRNCLRDTDGGKSTIGRDDN
jgi:hypothetical protein